MASKTVADGVLARLGPKVGDNRTWTSAGNVQLPVYGPNERNGIPVDASSFIDVEFPVAMSEQITIGSPGSNIYRETGVFRLIIAAQRGAGVDDGLTWADELAALYRGKAFAGVQTFAPNPPVIDDSNDNGNYYTLAVAVPYQFDIYG